jgi:hypothetical protein
VSTRKVSAGTDELARAQWRKASASKGNGACVEVAPLDGARWRKATASQANGDCVEVAALDGGRVAVRDSKDRDHGPVIVFTSSEWRAFLDRAKSGEAAL